jgi:hypothetical protein
MHVTVLTSINVLIDYFRIQKGQHVGSEITYQFEIILDVVIEITKCVIFLLPQYPQHHHTHVSCMWAALAQLCCGRLLHMTTTSGCMLGMYAAVGLINNCLCQISALCFSYKT